MVNFTILVDAWVLVVCRGREISGGPCKMNVIRFGGDLILMVGGGASPRIGTWACRRYSRCFCGGWNRLTGVVASMGQIVGRPGRRSGRRSPVSSSRVYVLIYIDGLVFLFVFWLGSWAGDCARTRHPVIVVRGLGIDCSLRTWVL